jgi:small-conductance mechanosensitive channel
MRGIALAIVLGAFNLLAAAQSPSPADAPNALPAAKDASNVDELERARREQERLTTLPVETPLLDERRGSLARLIALLGAQERRKSAAPTVPDAPGPGSTTLMGPGPYAVATIDALRDQRDALASQRSGLASSLRVLDGELESLVLARRKADETLRLRQEQLAHSAEKDRDRLQAETDLARTQARVAALEVARADAERSEGQGRLESLDRGLVALEREIERVRSMQVIDEPGLSGVAEASRKARQDLTKELDQATKRLSTAAARRDESDPVVGRVLAAQRATIAALTELDRIEQGKEEAWRLRRQALIANGDAARQESARKALATAIEQIDARLRVATEQLDATRASARAQRLQIEALPTGDVRRPAEQRVLEALQLEIDTRERVEEQLARLKVLLTRSRNDIDVAEPRTLPEWSAFLAASLAHGARSVWEYELFSATDSSVVDGRTVTLDYGVTVGKSVGVLVLFGLGFWFVRFLARRFVAQLVRRTKVSEQFGRVIYRWIMWTLGLAVLVGVLKLTRIPLTAFAFLGGALAIGVGFGTQTIIKNLISGVIILFERKLRVGDIVTIGSLSGTVAAVDLRATTVRGFDGIDFIVPNSNLLENQVSNWTYLNSTMRRSVNVAVAYDTDLQQAARILLECATRVAGVMSEPAPEVLLTNFGSDGVECRLQFWIRLQTGLSGPVIESNLRFAISDRFRAANISIPYPQRDVHLHVPG